MRQFKLVDPLAAVCPATCGQLLLAAALALGFGQAQAAVYRVGQDAACTHGTVQGALDAAAANPNGPHTVRLVTGVMITSNLEVLDPAADIDIIGGYANCAANFPDGNNLTVLRNDPNSPNGKRVLRIVNGNALPRRQIGLEQLTIEGGRDPSGDLGLGGGILALGKVTVELRRLTEVRDNRAANGGGVAMFNFTSNPEQYTRLVLSQNAAIRDNEALGSGDDGNGGGVFAIGGTEVRLLFAEVSGNVARRHGGGLYLGGNTDALELDPVGFGQVQISGNQAGTSIASPQLGFGGGIYVSRATIRYGSANTPQNRASLIIRENVANFGGGLYLLGGTIGAEYSSAELRNVELILNEARGAGGALLLRNAAELRVWRWGTGVCPIAGRQRPCTKIQANVARNGDVLTGFGSGPVARMVHDEGVPPPALQISGAFIAANSDLFGTTAAIDARGNSIVEVTRSILVGNSASGTLSFRSLIEIGGPFLDFSHNTVLAQSSDLASLFYTPPDSGTINAFGSFLYMPGLPLINASEQARISHEGCLLSHSLNGLLAAGSGLVRLEPPLLDEDFAPRGGSTALDRCSGFSQTPLINPALDVFGNATVDVLSVPNVPGGAIDLGAVEQVDILHYSGFGLRPNN